MTVNGLKIRPLTSAPRPAVAPRPAARVTGNSVLAKDGPLGVERLALDNPTFHNKVTLHITPDESRLAILDAIKNANDSFYLEIFIWHNDESGREIAQALIDRKARAAAEGKPFDLKVMIDWSGLRDATNPTQDTGIVKFLQTNGIDVRQFNKGGVNPLATGYTPITHRKLFIVDGQKFLSGGRNIGDEYLRPSFFSLDHKKEAAWHDLMFTVEGDETQRITNEFFKNWVRAGGKRPDTLPTARPAPGGKAWVQSVVTDPLLKKKEVREAHRKVILGAQKEIRIAYPYFSDDTLIDALILAKRQKPQLSIKVMMPGQGERGIPGFLYSNLNAETARQLLEEGIEVRFQDSRIEGKEAVTCFSHFKAMVVDGKLLSIGSANGDARTLAQNHELNCLIVDDQVAKRFLDDVMSPDWQRARPYTEADLKKIPFWKRWLMSALELFDFIF